MNDQTPGITLDETGLAVPAGEIVMTEVPVKDLPLYIILTNMVFAAGLPQTEFKSDEEFDDYLARYAEEHFPDPKERARFIKRQKINAVRVPDEIQSEYAWQFNGDVHIDNARLCGFGVLKSEAKLYYMFQAGPGGDIPSQFAAYQALTFGMVDKKYLPLLGSPSAREKLKNAVGSGVYRMVAEALGIAGRGQSASAFS
ncbi:MAG: hypothetical protein K6T80_04685 [Firmicutes bacterium]|nr:hypothetical protein [Bacillota bacterium]